MIYSVCDTDEYLDHRSPTIETKITPIRNQPKSSNIQPEKSHAATTNSSFPSKEQAIIIDAINGTTVKDYVMAVAKTTGPNAIRFASRISNHRICIYFDSKTTTKQFTNNYKTLNINNTNTTVRPLLNPSQPIILSNVSPTIPHEFIEKFLMNKNIKATSKLTFLRAGLQEPFFAHIMGFRRQIFIDPDDAQKISESFLITHDDTQSRMFVSTDRASCFLCKQEGHIAKQCTLHTQPTMSNLTNNRETNSSDIPREMEQTLSSSITKETTSIPHKN